MKNVIFVYPIAKGQIAALGLKQWQIARRLNISETYLSRILLGKAQPSERFVKKIAVVLQIEPKSLLATKREKMLYAKLAS